VGTSLRVLYSRELRGQEQRGQPFLKLPSLAQPEGIAILYEFLYEFRTHNSELNRKCLPQEQQDICPVVSFEFDES
jgi:hypothetical protein